MLRSLCTFVLLCSLVGCAHSSQRWELVYTHDADGNPLAGSKAALIEAVRAGRQVRIYLKGRRIEHAMDSHFLTVWDGEVFAQTAPIQTQAPTPDPPAVTFRNPGIEWRAILGTDGSFRAFADGQEPNQRSHGLSWFAER